MSSPGGILNQLAIENEEDLIEKFSFHCLSIDYLRFLTSAENSLLPFISNERKEKREKK